MTKAERLATKIVDRILDEGLAASTWRDANPHAYDTLLDYRKDMERSAAKVIQSNPSLSGHPRVKR